MDLDFDGTHVRAETIHGIALQGPVAFNAPALAGGAGNKQAINESLDFPHARSIGQADHLARVAIRRTS